ncbi:MAG TPA: sulfurtransferase [Bryobacteraceae bacterium]|jgi:thiosulfate/3-mercaptopyruvate sulfurtransferase
MKTQRLMTLSLAIASAAFAAETAPMIVDVNWLSSHLNDPNLVLLHVGPKAPYEKGHIPGARWISLDDIEKPMNHQNPKEIMLELPAPETLRATFGGRFGIGPESRVVVYFGEKAAFQSSTRVILTLDYIGLGGHTSILNGGMPAWTTAGKPLTADVPAVKEVTFPAVPTKDVVVDAEFVKAVSQHPNQKLIDARAPVFYKGIEATYGKNGHIPGAVNLPYTEILDGSLNLDRDRLTTLFRNAGINPGDTVVAYCHVGQQATTIVFTARLLGHPVFLYDGSFEDWAKNSRGPVEK